MQDTTLRSLDLGTLPRICWICHAGCMAHILAMSMLPGNFLSNGAIASRLQEEEQPSMQGCGHLEHKAAPAGSPGTTITASFRPQQVCRCTAVATHQLFWNSTMGIDMRSETRSPAPMEGQSQWFSGQRQGRCITCDCQHLQRCTGASMRWINLHRYCQVREGTGHALQAGEQATGSFQ
jgi:hypothetical protein